jgi:alkylation response protein AidB-like acyl-CoA dehydrogenase
VDFSLNAEEQWVLDTAMSLVPTLAARAGRYDADLMAPEEDLEDMRKSGLLTLPIPKKYGGRGSGWFDGANPFPYLLAIRTLALGNPVTAHFFQVHCHAMQAFFPSATPEQIERLVPEFLQGAMMTFCASEPGRAVRGQYNMGCSARRVDGGYVVNGLKNYCTLATVAKYHGISVGIEGQAGPESYLRVLIPTDHPGAEIDLDWWQPVGMRGCLSPIVRFHDVFVPHADVLGAPGDYLTHRWQSRFHLGFTSNFVGSSDAIMRFAADYLRDKGTAQHPYTQLRVGEAKIMYDAAEALWLRAIGTWQAGDIARAEVISNEAKHMAMETVKYVLDKCGSVCGSTVMFERFPLQRYMRDMAFHTLHDSLDRASQITGQALLGVEYDPTVKH